MNKILVSSANLENNYVLDNNILIFDIYNIDKTVNITLKSNTFNEIIIYNNNSNININLKENKNSKLKMITFNKNGKTDINNDLYEESEFYYFNSLINNKEINNSITINHLESKSISDIKNHGFSINKSKLVFNITGNIVKTAKSCKCNQDNQIIENDSSNSTILPILLIDNYDVLANHSAYVGEFKEEYLFYLKSRGISEIDSKNLLLSAFLVGYLDISDDIKEKLNSTILEFVKEVSSE